MATLGIIPARGGSKRIPGKNKLDFCGKPLIAWMLEAASSATRLDVLAVNSDDDEILEIVERFAGGKITTIKRPASLAGDTSKAIEYVHHTLEALKKDFDAVVILQPTSPLTLPEDIDGTISLLLNSGADSAVSVAKLDHAQHPVKMKTLHGDRLLPFLEAENGRISG